MTRGRHRNIEKEKTICQNLSKSATNGKCSGIEMNFLYFNFNKLIIIGGGSATTQDLIFSLENSGFCFKTK